MGAMPARDARLAVIIVSPLASRIRDPGARARVVAAATEALRRRGAERVEVVESGEPATLRAAAADAVARGAGTVVLAGGDGTVRDASGVLAHSGVAVGIIPCGTGNLFASSIGLSRDPDRAAAALATGEPRPADLGLVRLERPGEADRETPFAVACGTGFDARVMAATTRAAKARHGIAAYFVSASRLLGQLTPSPTVITVDGRRTETESVVVLIANSGGATPLGIGPRLPVPHDDGLIHAFVLPRGGVLGGIQGILELALASSAGSSATGAGLRLIGRSVRVEVQPPAPVEVDGDPFPAAVLDARVQAGALSVIRG